MKIDKWKKAYLVAGISDLIDITPHPLAGFLASFPIIGDPLDLLTTFILWKILGNDFSLAGLPEFIPSADPIPFHVLSVYLAQKKILTPKGVIK